VIFVTRKRTRQCPDADGLPIPRLPLRGARRKAARSIPKELSKADPDPLPAVKRLAKRFSINLDRYGRKSLLFAWAEAGVMRSEPAAR
jgi:hypothetical protein